MTSNIHVASRNLLIKLKKIKFWGSQKFASQNFSLVAICKSSSMENLKILQIFSLQNFLQYYSTNFKTGKSEFNFFWEFSMCVTYVKTFAGVPDHICSFCNCWTLLTSSQKSVSGMLMNQLANSLKYLIGCWISHDFTLKNVLTWFVISRTCEFKMSFRFSLSFIHFSKFSTKI